MGGIRAFILFTAILLPFLQTGCGKAPAIPDKSIEVAPTVDHRSVGAEDPDMPPWYGVDIRYPFCMVDEETGFLLHGEEMDDTIEQYYSFCRDWDSPYIAYEDEQVSNYPQFNSAQLLQYRWHWLSSADETKRAPLQPQPYQDGIELEIAQFTTLFKCDLQMSDADYAALPLNEKTALQSQWVDQADYADMTGSYYQVKGLCIFNGDSRTESDYFSGGRAKNIRIEINSEFVRTALLEDTPFPQLIDLDYTQEGIAEPVKIRIEVLDSYPGDDSDIFITEIGVGIDSNLLPPG